MKIETSEFREASAFRVSVGTNGYKGGDAGHGGKTHFELTSDGASIQVEQLDDGTGVKIEMGGDSELSTFIDALEFAVGVLREQAKQS